MARAFSESRTKIALIRSGPIPTTQICEAVSHVQHEMFIEPATVSLMGRAGAYRVQLAHPYLLCFT